MSSSPSPAAFRFLEAPLLFDADFPDEKDNDDVFCLLVLFSSRDAFSFLRLASFVSVDVLGSESGGRPRAISELELIDSEILKRANLSVFRFPPQVRTYAFPPSEQQFEAFRLQSPHLHFLRHPLGAVVVLACVE